MKKESISRIMSGIDDEYIKEAASPVKKSGNIRRYITVAACIALVLIAGIILSQGDIISPSHFSSEGTTANESGGGDKKFPETATEGTAEAPSDSFITPGEEIDTELAIESVTGPKWEDMIIPMRYGEITLGEITYSSQCTEISSENILSKLGEAKMQGYDIYTDTYYTVTGEAYSVKSISTECAVAVRIDNGEEYFIYVNSWYVPEDLADFISDLDLKNTVLFRKAFIDEYKHSDTASEHSQRVYADFDDKVIWDMLEDCLSAENTEYNHPYDRIGIETDMPLLGYKNISFCITPDGYIITNILNTQKCFFVGEQKFREFDEYLKNNVPYKEYNTVYEMNPDGTIPGKGEDGQSTPGFNPDAPVQISPPYDPSQKEAMSNTQKSSSQEIPQDFIIEETTRTE